MLRAALLSVLLLLIACDSSDPIAADSSGDGSGTSAIQETPVSTETTRPTPTNPPQVTPALTAAAGEGVTCGVFVDGGLMVSVDTGVS